MQNGSISLEEAVGQYMATLSMKEAARAQQELARFIRWYGNGRPLRDMKPPELERFAETLSSNGAQAPERLEPLKAFFVYARKRGLTASNLGVHLRLKKVAGTEVKVKHGQRITVTQEGHARLEQELERLKAERPRIAEELRTAMADKDFRENAPLDAARDHQAHIEARIREIEATLRAAEVAVHDSEEDGKRRARLGSRIKLRDLTYDEEMQVILVGPREAKPAKGMISVASPTGSELVGKEAGEVVEVQAPAGVQRYRVESVEN